MGIGKQMNKRDALIALLALGAAPFAARSQVLAKIPRVGVLWHAANAEGEKPFYGALLEGFKGLGYVEGRNIIFEHRFANETGELFASQAAELVASKVDILVSGATTSSYARKATATIPIVFMYVPDPVRINLVKTLARPGGNATGLTTYAAELTGLRLQFLKEALPGLARVAFLVNPEDDITPTYVEQAQTAAAKLGIAVHIYEARTLDALAPAFDAMAKARMQALIVPAGGLFYVGREAIGKMSLARRIPICAAYEEFLNFGAMMSYGPDMVAITRRAAFYVDKILKGSKPADMAVEIPTKFDFLINARIAQQLGLKIPQTVLLRANRVIK